MSKKDHIEEAFKEGFKNFEAPVDPSVWAGVQSGLMSGAGASAAGGMSIAKMIVIGVSAVAAVSVGVALYISSYDDSNTHTENEQQQQIVEETPEKLTETVKETVELNDYNPEQEESGKENIEPSTQNTQENPVKNNAGEHNETPERNEESSGANSPSSNQNPGESSESSNNRTGDNNMASANNSNSSSPDKQDDSKKEEKEELSLIASVDKQEGYAPLTVNFDAKSNGDVTWMLRDEQGNTTSFSGPLHEVELEKPGSYFISCTSNLGDAKDYQEFAVNVKSNFTCSIDESLLDFDGGIVLTPSGFDKKELKFNCSNIQEVEVFSMVVMDGRTQEKVFETHRLEDMNWSGKDASGATLKKGTYFVVIFIGTKEGETIDPIKKRLIIR